MRRMSIPAGKPEIFELEPRGMQRGVTMEIKLIGTNLIGLTEIKLSNPKLKGELIRENEWKTNTAWARITATADLPRNSYEISVKNTNAESSRLKLYVDDLPTVYESATNKMPALKLPISFWGRIDPRGDADDIVFEAQSGQLVVFDLAAQSIGSKVKAMLTLFDDKGVLLASKNGFDGGDPLLDFKIPATGRYRVRVSDEMAGGSRDHFYRLSMGAFTEVVGCYPIGVTPNSESDVELIGFNLPAGSKAHVKAGMSGEVEVPLDTEKFRSRKPLKVIIGSGPELVETEPNDTVDHAMPISAPAVVNGRIWHKDGQPDVDLYKFEAKRGQRWIIETFAAQRGSPVDTKLEILHADGKPVERAVLQAVRNSQINFRPVDSVAANMRLDNYLEMDLDEYYYMQGDVTRILRMPQGPDSDMLFYTSNGKRRAWFDTTATAHSLDEVGYIVEAHPPGEKLEPNGLPVFPINYENDDESQRQLGTDSRVHFNVQEDGTYIVRVTDTRGYSGERFVYRLILREAKPDFNVTLNGANPTVELGSGREFSVTATRLDGFEGEIKVAISNLPPGFTVSSPLVIEAGHNDAKATLNATMDAMQPDMTNTPAITATASAMIDGKEVTKKVNDLGKIKLGDKPKLWVYLEPTDTPISTNALTHVSEKPLELTITPGQSIPAWIKVRRNGHEELITFTVENLPFGIIVDNIGLNGVLIPKGENERQIFLNAAKWVADMDRPCYAIENQAGRQTSLPVMLHVRHATGVSTAQAH